MFDKDEVEELVLSGSSGDRTGTRGVRTSAFEEGATPDAMGHGMLVATLEILTLGRQSTSTDSIMKRSVPVARPRKRTRVTAINPDTLSPRPPSPGVKCERSPSPTSVERRLVSSGTKRYAPVPNDCLSSCPDYKQNRSEWVERCVKELEALSLIPERKLIRDDGLVIDWRSHVPVWSDILKPDPLDLAATNMLAHRSNAQWHRTPIRSESLPVFAATQEGPTSSGAQPPLKERLPVPPRPSLKRRNNSSQSISIDSPPGGPGSSSPCSEGPRFRDETGSSYTRVPSLAGRIPIPSDISNQHDQASIPPKPPKKACGRSIAPCPPSWAEGVSEMTLNYLRRYVQTYEADRTSLASAYSRNASFAYRVLQTVRNTSPGALPILVGSPQCFSSGAKRTRLDIVTTLLTLPCLHSNAQSAGTAHVEYDILYLGGELGMFAICRVVLSTKTVVHNFILQRKEADVEDAAIGGVWPLTATAHQILVFQT